MRKAWTLHYLKSNIRCWGTSGGGEGGGADGLEAALLVEGHCPTSSSPTLPPSPPLSHPPTPPTPQNHVGRQITRRRRRRHRIALWRRLDEFRKGKFSWKNPVPMAGAFLQSQSVCSRSVRELSNYSYLRSSCCTHRRNNFIMYGNWKDKRSCFFRYVQYAILYYLYVRELLNLRASSNEIYTHKNNTKYGVVFFTVYVHAH